MDIFDMIKDMDINSGTTGKKFCEVETLLGVSFPDEYKQFMLNVNGIEGAIGQNAYIVIWPIEEIVDLNNEYGVNDVTPGLIYFGSDGGNSAYAFDIRKNNVVVEFPLDSIHIEDAKLIADSFNKFIEKIYTD